MLDKVITKQQALDIFKQYQDNGFIPDTAFSDLDEEYDRLRKDLIRMWNKAKHPRLLRAPSR